MNKKIINLMDLNNFIDIIENFSYLTCFKLLFILALFFLNIFLYFSEPNKNNVLESGFNTNSKKVQTIINYIVTSCTFYGTFLAIKSDNYNTREKLEILERERQKILEFSEERSKLKSELIKENIENINLIELALKIINSDTKISNRIGNLIKNRDNPVKFKEVQSNVQYEVKTRETMIDSFLKDQPQYEEILKGFSQEKDSVAQSAISNQLNDDEINKSFILAPLVQKFENFDTMSKLAVSLLLSNSLLFSALSSIFFVLYGDYLINRFQLEVKFPKLAKIIKLRRKFQRYYLIFDSLIIIGVILMHVIFSLAILLL
jgi:hypothetical protein